MDHLSDEEYVNLVSQKPCHCQSGKPRYALYDARGIFCDYVCEDCVDKKKAKYRPEIFEDSNYDTFDEQVEEDY